MLFKPLITGALALIVTMVQTASAVCAPGQMAVGVQMTQYFTGPSGAFYVYSGFLMANNRGIISVNGNTQDDTQYCNGGYSNGASVQCSGDNVVGAVDTQGQHWNCWNTNDSSCDAGGTGLRRHVLACCSRA
ncbi:hypothetical protein FRC17_000389 [Serendipita sp. 399]|nr:hypothetical protein FRC17_000389 [Serendipita sp. 399]